MAYRDAGWFAAASNSLRNSPSMGIDGTPSAIALQQLILFARALCLINSGEE